MFFRNKNHDETLRQLESQMQTLTQAVTAQIGRLDTLTQNLSQLDIQMQDLSQLDTGLNQSISQLQTEVHKHDMAIEDLLDEWDEKKSDEASTLEHVQEARHTESLLLQLFEEYQEQFWNLKHFTASKDDSWAVQIAFMEESLERCRRSCQISLIQECGVKVNYELHEVIDATDTSDPALDKTVADIYHCGYLYKGTVRKKAQVSAYRFSN